MSEQSALTKTGDTESSVCPVFSENIMFCIPRGTQIITVSVYNQMKVQYYALSIVL